MFSNATLSNCFSNQDCDNSPGCSGCEVEESEPWSRSQSYESSKMKAALKVLKSSKPQHHTSEGFSAYNSSMENNVCPKNFSTANNAKFLIDSPECQILYGNRSVE